MAWHYVAMHPELLSLEWRTPPHRIQALTSAIAGRLGTAAPLGHAVTRPSAPAEFQPTPVRLRTTAFLRRARITLPAHARLHAWLSFPRSGLLSLDETAAFFNENLFLSDDCVSWYLPPLGEHVRGLIISVHPDGLAAIHSSLSLASLVLPSSTSSHSSFLPPELHWREPTPALAPWRQREAPPPAWFLSQLDTSSHNTGESVRVRPLPKFHACSVILRRHRWKRRFGRYLGQAARIILDSKLCLLLDVDEVEPMSKPNLKTCYESREATEFVDNIVSEYLVTNVCSWYPPDAPPLCICPIGVVDKNTAPFHCLVIDARGPNSITSRWSCLMKSLASAAHIFEPGSVCFTFDVGKAYIVSPYQGCRARLLRRMRADGVAYTHVGCEPHDCGLSCSKCMLGFRWRGHTFVFNAPMFGARVSGNILDCLLEPFDRWVRARGLPYLRWVDDMCFAIPPRPEYRHDTTHCGGVEGCFMCKDTMTRAQALQREIAEFLMDLGFTLNDKLTAPSQRGEFIGLGWDTIRNTFYMAEGKAEKMAALAESFCSTLVASRRDLAQLRGKLTWFTPCLHSVALLTCALNSFIGSPSDDALWDAKVTLPDDVLRECRHWQSTLRARRVHEHPMWRLRPQQLLAAYHAGSTIVQAYLETDASLRGWGCTLWVLDGSAWIKHTACAPWSGDDPTIQVHCEAEALGRALVTFRDLLTGLAVLHATDCSPTVALPEKGSADSRTLQLIALCLWSFCSLHDIHLSSAWVPGDHMVRSGTDALSRDALRDPHCARLTPTGWRVVLDLAQQAGLPLSIDWFADDVNHQLPTFWSRLHSTGSSGVDAFAAPSWSVVQCPACLQSLNLGSYFFPPVPLLDSVVSKAKQDRARGVFIVPRIINTIWWGVLQAAAVTAFHRLPLDAIDASREFCDKQYLDYTWNVVAFDFDNGPPPDLAPCRCALAETQSTSLSSQARHHEHLHSLLARALLDSDLGPR